MKYVVDACVGVKWFIDEMYSDEARQLQTDYLQGRHELIAPDIFLGELTHSLTRCERRGLEPVGSVIVHLARLVSCCPELRSFIPLTTRAAQISSQAGHGFFDCLYVALAEQEACELVTADERFISNLQPRFPFIIFIIRLTDL